MARSKKPASLKSGNTESKAQLEERASKEKSLNGNDDLVSHIPEHLDELAKEYYKFLVEELQIGEILSNLDIPLLEQTSDCLSKMRKADEYIKKEGILVEQHDRNSNIIVKEHPAVNTKQKYLNQFRALSTQLGLSPASRAQLADMQKDKDDNDADPLLEILNN